METLARKKYHVFATMRAVEVRNAKTARELRTLAESESHQLDVLELDVTDNASVERAVDVVIAQRDRIDVLVNNWTTPVIFAIVEPSAFFTPLFQKHEEAGDTLLLRPGSWDERILERSRSKWAPAGEIRYLLTSTNLHQRRSNTGI